MTHTKVYRTELTPVSFLRRAAYVFPNNPAIVHGDTGVVDAIHARNLAHFLTLAIGCGTAQVATTAI